MPFRQNKKNIHRYVMLKSCHALTLNAYSVIVANESISCPQCEKFDLKTTQSMLGRVQVHKNAGKPKNVWDLKDFYEEQQLMFLKLCLSHLYHGPIRKNPQQKCHVKVAIIHTL